MDTEKQPKETFVEQMERVNRTNPFMIHNNIRAVALSEDAAEVCAEVTEDSLNAMQTVHGGLMFVMAEIAAGLVTRNDGRKYVTLDSSFRFLRGSSAKELRGVAKITKLHGSKVGGVEYVAFFDISDTCLFDVLRSVKIRTSKLEVDDSLTGALHGKCFLIYFSDSGRSELVHSFCE